jgi:large subunit ribosomal protein L32
MAQPKKKTSRMKRGHRRSHHKATTMSFVKCENCGELKLAHRVCPECGHYNNEKVIETAEL